MRGFLDEIGKQLAGRWMTLLTIPGLLFLITTAAARGLGHSMDFSRAGDRLRHLTPAHGEPPATLVLSALVVLALATFAGLLAHWMSAAIEELWLTPWHLWPAGPLLRNRRRRWARAHWRYQQADQRRELAELAGLAQTAEAHARVAVQQAARRNHIALTRPRHAGWMTDRLDGCGSRIMGQYGLDLDMVWPRMWLLLPEPARTEVRAARERFSQASGLAAWSVLYVVVGCVWWYPTALGGLAAGFLAWTRARRAVGGLADLVESSMDVHSPLLAEHLGVPLPNGRITPAIGATLRERIRKGA
ncbi:hypothetical protein AB0958_08105 [Streptomyces sp. NPDC006655]|uniref:hypothetical protein n=1 Tax=Streptomyces sp. NPDC006655 TaxID=3156898 RepID=UPI003451356F